MQNTGLMSPIAKRLKEKGPNKYCLVKTRTITDDDMEYVEKWKTIKQWYEAIENDPNAESIHKILQSMVNAIIYQERIYFAITRDSVVELFKNDKNWKGKKTGMRNASYKDLLEEMVDSGMFEAHAENDRFYAQKKPRIFKLIDQNVLSLMKPVSEDIQLKQVFDFVENNSGDEVGDDLGDEVGDVVLVEDLVEGKELGEVNSSAERTNASPVTKNQEIEFLDLLARQFPKNLPKFQDIEFLVELAIANCSDFDVTISTKEFEKHIKNCVGEKTPALKKHIANLVEKFKTESDKQTRFNKAKDIPLVYPVNPSSAGFLKASVNMEEEAENYTLKMLNISFGRENIKVLKRQLERADNEQQKLEIKAEIDFWEGVV